LLNTGGENDGLHMHIEEKKCMNGNRGVLLPFRGRRVKLK
jgi:hypothetical protein